MKYYEVPKSHNLQILRIIHFCVYQAKTDKLIRDIRDFSFIIDCQQINDNGISFLIKIISAWKVF